MRSGGSKRPALLLALVLTAPIGRIDAADLRGSPASMERQHEVATEQGIPFLQGAADVREHVRTQQLVRIESNASLVVNDVSYPFARPAVNLFVQRLASQFQKATGGQLVVTSLTRPESQQPSNAHALSVHPAGLAVDFRIPAVATQRRWLETTLLSLENRGVLDVTRERNPPHYHVAVFPEQYEAYVAALPAAKPSVSQRSTAETIVTPVIGVEENQARVTSWMLIVAIAVATLSTTLFARLRLVAIRTRHGGGGPV